MVDALVSTVLQQLTTIMAAQVEQEVRLVVGVDDEVQKMTSNFEAIQAVLAEAEQKQLKDATIRDWLDKLKEVSYEIDDVLDEWSTAIMKFKLEADKSFSHHKRKVRSFIPSPCLCCKRVARRHDIAHKIKKLNKKVDAIATEKQRYGFDPQFNSNKPSERQMTIPVINVSEVEGREEDKTAVMKLLLSESSQGPPIPVTSIVGMGGIGKTTLASLVYNDKETETHFDKRIWVCVSDSFNEIWVAKAILESLMDSAPNLAELPVILEHIQRHIKEKKFLLVLDDVWSENSKYWEELKNSLMCGSPGSKILVTTRKDKVAFSMGSRSTDIVRMWLLSMEKSWSLFSRIAFFDLEDHRMRNELEDIGRKIVEKCKGLPLAIKTLASLLCLRKSRKEWESILKSDLWEIEDAESDLLAPLLLAYYDLSSEIKRCFLYCAIFPKNYEFDKYELIDLWTAQSYLKETSTQDTETIGLEYFDKLVACSLIQVFVHRNYALDTLQFKMHDMVHDLAQFVSKNECISVVPNDYEQRWADSSLWRDTRHLRMEVSNETPFAVSIDRLRKLRSLLIVSEEKSSLGESMPNLFSHSTSLRALKLRNCSFDKVADEVGKLMHLRHLDLSNCESTGSRELPEAICELYNLQILDVSGCSWLEKLPRKIAKLLNLKEVRNLGTRLTFMPQGIVKLSCLMRLDSFVVPIDGVQEGEFCGLGSIYNLNKLGTLGITGLAGVRAVVEAKKAQLQRLGKLSCLLLAFDFPGILEAAEGRLPVNTDEEVIEDLAPPPGLKELVVFNYRAPRFSPKWIVSLNNLLKLKLQIFFYCEHLPPVGELPSLEVLHIEGWLSVKKVGREFLGIDLTSASSFTVAFPKLKHLEFHYMYQWKEWEDENMMSKVEIMPCLQYIRLNDCPNLQALPDWFLQLSKCNASSTTNSTNNVDRQLARVCMRSL